MEPFASFLHPSASTLCSLCQCPKRIQHIIFPLMQLRQVMRALQAMVAAEESFVTTDYMLPTPDWAVYGADEAGFDPQETRFKKIRNHPQKQALQA